jgi:hypothetical protein
MRLDPKDHAHALYFRAVNKRGQPATLRITAIFLSQDDANEHMLAHANDAVIAVIGTVVFLADVNDEGVGRRPGRCRKCHGWIELRGQESAGEEACTCP